jgi:hypothetical protein
VTPSSVNVSPDAALILRMASWINAIPPLGMPAGFTT